MATKKDLVDAYAFSRRRLVTAFVSGAPGGREVEPARPGRTVVGGVALAVLLVAGAAVAGVFQQRADVDWDQPGLVADDDTGALYVILDDVPGSDQPRLRSVVNVTSAQLILGSDVEPVEVPGEEIAEREKGPAIGIVNAPATVPGPDDLVASGWTACTATGRGVKVDIATERLVAPAPETGVVVRVGGERYLVATAPGTGDVPARAYSYPLPRGTDDRLYSSLRVGIPGDAIEVSRGWLDLFPPGGPLDERGLDVPGIGERPPADFGYPRSVRIGDWFESDGELLLVTADGQVTLTPFAAAVLRDSDFSGYRPRERVVATDRVRFRLTEEPYAGAHWPRDLPDPGEPVEATDEVCAVTDTAAGRPPGVALALEPQGSASAETVEAGTEVSVEPGSGAVVRSRGWDDAEGGAPRLIDDRGIDYLLRDDGVTVANLGYADVPEVVVPDPWFELFTSGVELSRDAALCPPELTGGTRRSTCP